MLELPYNQFTGTVQVMKAVGNHLVLTFCDTLPKSQIFTVILTRKLHLLSRDVNINCLIIIVTFLITFLYYYFVSSPGCSISQKSTTPSWLECAISTKGLQKFIDHPAIQYHYVDCIDSGVTFKSNILKCRNSETVKILRHFFLINRPQRYKFKFNLSLSCTTFHTTWIKFHPPFKLCFFLVISIYFRIRSFNL